MFVFANIVVIALVALIAYWWANQGLFSALMHLLCTIAAGAIAFAFWEPLVLNVLLGGGDFDNFAWGFGLVGLFTVSLFVMRIACDKIAPANVRVPQWASLSVGGVLGAAAGTISVGMLILGVGFVQSRTNVMGWEGWRRNLSNGQITEINNLWFPAHEITAGFYDWASVGSMGLVSRPLRTHQPQLARQASLFRDTYDRGRGEATLPPDSVEIAQFMKDEYRIGEDGSLQPRRDGVRYMVQLRFDKEALDYGQFLTLTASQVRMVGEARGGEKPEVLAPNGWAQRWDQWDYYEFTSASDVATSRAGQNAAELWFDFIAPRDFEPAFVQVKALRLEPPSQIADATDGVRRTLTPIELAPVQLAEVIDGAISVSNDIRPISVSVNTMPGTIQERDNLFTSGEGVFNRGGSPISRKLAINGIFEPDGTRVVRVNIGWDSPLQFFSAARQYEVREDAEILLVDRNGNEYSPIGYFWDRGRDVALKLEPVRRIGTYSEVPQIPTGGNQKLELLFYVPVDVELTGFRLGDLDLGVIQDFRVPRPRL